MQRLPVRFACLLTLALATHASAETPTVPLPSSPTPAAEDAKAVVRELAPYVQAHENDKVPTPELIQNMAKLAQAYAASLEPKQAQIVWIRLLAAFDRANMPRDGSKEATLAAEAQWQLVQPAVTKGMAVSFSPRPGSPRPWADMRAQLDEVTDTTLGPKSREVVAGMEPRRAGGLVDQLLRVGQYKSPVWNVTAALQAGRLLLKQGRAMRDAARPGAVEPGEATTVDTALKDTSLKFDERGLAVLEAAWRAAEEAAVASQLRTDLRKELNKLKPNEYPLSEGGSDTEAVTPQQQEASRLAGLALKATRLDLKVLYLTKAVKLDPLNKRYLDLLRAAEAEQAGKH